MSDETPPNEPEASDERSETEAPNNDLLGGYLPHDSFYTSPGPMPGIMGRSGGMGLESPTNAPEEPLEFTVRGPARDVHRILDGMKAQRSSTGGLEQMVMPILLARGASKRASPFEAAPSEDSPRKRVKLNIAGSFSIRRPTDPEDEGDTEWSVQYTATDPLTGDQRLSITAEGVWPLEPFAAEDTSSDESTPGDHE